MLIYLMAVDSEEERKKFEDIYYIYRDRMYKVAFGILKDEQEAENIVQDAFVTLIDCLEKINNISCHKTWNYIVTIVKNKCFNHLKKQNRMKSMEYEDFMDVMASQEKGPETIVSAQELSETLTELIQQLPYPYKEVLYLQYYNDMDGKSIAALIDETPENVRQIARRAREKLKAGLIERGYSHE